MENIQAQVRRTRVREAIELLQEPVLDALIELQASSQGNKGEPWSQRYDYVRYEIQMLLDNVAVQIETNDEKLRLALCRELPSLLDTVGEAPRCQMGLTAPQQLDDGWTRMKLIITPVI